MADTQCTNANIWDEWFPESVLADLLAGRNVVADIGQVRGVWKKRLEKEIRSGRLAKWRGKWFPTPGAPWGIGPDKTCYGTPELKQFFAEAKAGLRPISYHSTRSMFEGAA